MSGLSQFGRTFFNWHEIASVFPQLLKVGLLNTIILSVGAIVLGLIIGMLLAMMLVSRHGWVRAPARIYVDIFRGLPIILTIYVIGLGLPIAGIRPFGRDAYPYAIIALGLIAGAYISEIFRSGIQSVDRGQMEAARSLGLPYLAAMRLVIVPQGVRRVLPALTNQFVNIIKSSSLVYLLGLVTSQQELFSIGQSATTETGNFSPMVAAGVCYLILTIPLTHLVNLLDRRLREGKDARTAADEPPVQLMVAGGGR